MGADRYEWDHAEWVRKNKEHEGFRAMEREITPALPTEPFTFRYVATDDDGDVTIDTSWPPGVALKMLQALNAWAAEQGVIDAIRPGP